MPIIAGILSALKVARKRSANVYDDIGSQSSVDVRDLAPKHAEENARQGNTHQMILLLFLSAFLFSLQGMFLKFTTAMGIPSLEMVFIRAAFQGVFVVAGMIICRVDDPSANTNGSDIESGPVVDLAPIYDDEEKKDDEESAPATCVREEEFLLGKAYASKRYSTISTDSFLSAQTKQSSLRLIERPFGTTRHICHVVIVRGIIGGLGFINFFYTFSVLPLGDATTLVSLYPIITIFLSRVVLGEEIKPLHLVAAAFSATGAILISRPSFLFGSELIDSNQPPPPKLGYVTAMLGSFFASAVIVLIRKAGNVGAHTLQLLFSWVVFSLLVSSGGAGAIAAWLSEDARWRMPYAEELPIVLSVCIAGTIAHFLLNYSMRQLPATLGSLVRSSDIFWAYQLEIIVFGERPHAGTWFGVLFVCASLAMVLLQTNNRAQTSLLTTQRSFQRNQKRNCVLHR